MAVWNLPFDVASLSTFIIQFISQVMKGDVFAVSVLLIGIYLFVLLVNKLTGAIIFLLKKIFLVIIVGLAFYSFFIELLSRFMLEGATQELIIFGLAGIIVGVAAMSIAVYTALHTLLEGKRTPEQKMEDEAEEERKSAHSTDSEKEPFDVGVFLKAQMQKQNKSLANVLTYLVIAQFGVFSSKTIAAPNATVGMGFFAVFMVAALFFIKQSYKDYSKGVFHLIIAIFVGATLSIILGSIWGDQDIAKLLSVDYFASDSLVALVTGLSVSLFMGSKE